jgi:hypothetical protein
MNPRTLAEEFIDITDEMAALKKSNRTRRAELARKYAEDLAATHQRERALSARRAQIALRMTLTGRSLDELGRMVGVSGPFMCQLARKARKDNHA